MKRKAIVFFIMLVVFVCVAVGCVKNPNVPPDPVEQKRYSTRNFLSIGVGGGHVYEYDSSGKVVSYRYLGEGSVSTDVVGKDVLKVFNDLLTDASEKGDFLSLKDVLISSSDNFVALKVFGKASAYFVEFACADEISTKPYFCVAYLTDDEIVAACDAGVDFGLYDLYKKHYTAVGTESLFDVVAEGSVETFADFADDAYDFQSDMFVAEFVTNDACSKISAAKAVLNKLESDAVVANLTVDEFYRDFYSGKEVWNVKLHCDNDYYEYVVDACSEEVVSGKKYIHSSAEGYVAPVGTLILYEDAFKAACDDARVSNSRLTAFYVRLDKVDDGWSYCVNLKTAYSRFAYVVDAVTGAIVSMDGYSADYSSEVTDIGMVSADTAVSTAFVRAGVNDVKVKRTLTEVLYDGGWVYEVSFFSSGKFHQVTVKSNGKILGYVTDGVTIDDDEESEYISLSAAKEIAYDEAGAGTTLSDGDLLNLKTRFTRENGMALYKISFIYSDISYSYVINALDGEIIKSSSENVGILDDFDYAQTLTTVGNFLGKEDMSSVKVDSCYFPADGIDNATYYMDFYDGAYRYLVTIDTVSGDIVRYERVRVTG